MENNMNNIVKNNDDNDAMNIYQGIGAGVPVITNDYQFNDIDIPFTFINPQFSQIPCEPDDPLVAYAEIALSPVPQIQETKPVMDNSLSNSYPFNENLNVNGELTYPVQHSQEIKPVNYNSNYSNYYPPNGNDNQYVVWESKILIPIAPNGTSNDANITKTTTSSSFSSPYETNFKLDLLPPTSSIGYKNQVAYFVRTALVCPAQQFHEQIARFLPFPSHLLKKLQKKAEKRDLTTEEVFFLLIGGFPEHLQYPNTIDEGTLILTKYKPPFFPRDKYIKRSGRKANEIYVSGNQLQIDGRIHVKGEYRNLIIEGHPELYLQERCYYLYEKKINENDEFNEDDGIDCPPCPTDITRFHYLNVTWYLTHYRWVPREKKSKSSDHNKSDKKRKRDDDEDDDEEEDENEDDREAEDQNQSSNNENKASTTTGSSKKKQKTTSSSSSSKTTTKTINHSLNSSNSQKLLQSPFPFDVPSTPKIFYGRKHFNRHEFARKMKELLITKVPSFNARAVIPKPLPQFRNVHSILQSFSLQSASFHEQILQIDRERFNYTHPHHLHDHHQDRVVGQISPEVVMKELFPSTLSPITASTTKEMMIEEFKSFLRIFIHYFPEIRLHEEITEDEATPEAPKLTAQDFILYYNLDEILGCTNRNQVNQEYNKAIVKLYYAYYMIRDEQGMKNLIYLISEENYHGLSELFHFIYSSSEEKLILLYSLVMNDVGKSTRIIQVLKESQLLPDEQIYIDHDEKFYLFLLKVNDTNPSILVGWNRIQFSPSLRSLVLESQSTFINFPQLPQGEILQLCLAKFTELSKYAQFFRLILQIIDIAGAKSHLETRKAIILTDEVYQHSIVGIHLLLTGGKNAYPDYFDVIFRKDFLHFFQSTPEGRSIPKKERSILWFYYARTAALSRLNTHQPEDMIIVHQAWQQLRTSNPLAYQCLLKEFALTGCHPKEKEIAILIYFAPAIMDMSIQACSQKEKLSLSNGKMKGIFYGLQTLAMIYQESRRNTSTTTRVKDAYLNVNAAIFVRDVRDNFASFVMGNEKIVVLEEDRERMETRKPVEIAMMDAKNKKKIDQEKNDPTVKASSTSSSSSLSSSLLPPEQQQRELLANLTLFACWKYYLPLMIHQLPTNNNNNRNPSHHHDHQHDESDRMEVDHPPGLVVNEFPWQSTYLRPIPITMR